MVIHDRIIARFVSLLQSRDFGVGVAVLRRGAQSAERSVYGRACVAGVSSSRSAVRCFFFIEVLGW